MATAAKQRQLQELSASLEERQGFIVSAYSGLKVADMRDLRGQLRDKESQLKVVKNRIFYRSLKQDKLCSGVADQLLEQLHGPVAVVFAGSSFPAVSKILLDYSKKSEKLRIKAGYFEGSLLSQQEIFSLALLPGREELLGMVARGIQAPSTAIARGVEQIIAALARGIKAVGEKSGK